MNIQSKLNFHQSCQSAHYYHQSKKFNKFPLYVPSYFLLLILQYQDCNNRDSLLHLQQSFCFILGLVYMPTLHTNGLNMFLIGLFLSDISHFEEYLWQMWKLEISLYWQYTCNSRYLNFIGVTISSHNTNKIYWKKEKFRIKGLLSGLMNYMILPKPCRI